jgi:hypothetical protein
MNLPLSDQEREALADFLNEAIADGLYPLSLKLRPIRSVLAKLERSEAEADAFATQRSPYGGSARTV